MACEIEIEFGDTPTIVFAGQGTDTDPIVATYVGPADAAPVFADSATIEWSGTGEPGNPYVATFVGATGGDGCCNTAGRVESEAGTGHPQLIIEQDGGGADLVVDLCSFTAPNGRTAQRSGAFYDGCDTLDLQGDDANAETLFPAVGFAVGWRQLFSNGTGGQSAHGIVLLSAGPGGLFGPPQWHIYH